MDSTEAYHTAQLAISNLKTSIYSILKNATGNGLTNAEIGRSIGIYTGHQRHEGHIPRTLLAMMEEEGVVKQDEDSKRWSLEEY